MYDAFIKSFSFLCILPRYIFHLCLGSYLCIIFILCSLNTSRSLAGVGQGSLHGSMKSPTLYYYYARIVYFQSTDSNHIGSAVGDDP